MAGTPRMTIPTQLVLQALLEADEAYGAEIGTRTHLPSGTVHPILARLEGLAWVESRWENVDPAAEGRPARRYYHLTSEGRSWALDALDRALRVQLSPVPRLVRRPS
jgi:PadR family transcriptional regulator, regulatory protein PadR